MDPTQQVNFERHQQQVEEKLDLILKLLEKIALRNLFWENLETPIRPSKPGTVTCEGEQHQTPTVKELNSGGDVS